MPINKLPIIGFVFCFLLFFSSCQEKQIKSFEGCIKYKVESENNMEDLDASEYGTQVDVYIKKGSFKEVSKINGFEDIIWYDNKKGQAYLYMPSKGGETEKWKTDNWNRDLDVYDCQIIPDKDTLILGFPCKLLIAKNIYNTKRYYFSEKLPFDANYWSNFKSTGKYQIMSKINAISLKIDIHSFYPNGDRSFLSLEAIEVNQTALSDTIFNVPAFFSDEE